MKNLRQLSEARYALAEESASVQYTHMAVDTSTSRVFLVDNELRLYIITHGSKPAVYDLRNTQDASGADLVTPISQCVSLAYLLDSDSVCVACDTGEILVVDSNRGTAICVGSFDAGLETMAWSPDGEIVVLLTKEGIIAALSGDWDPLGEEFPLRTDGSTCDLDASIDWRADGQYWCCHYAVNDGEGTTRSFSVFNREFEHTADSEKTVKGTLSSAFAWRPSGNYLTTAREFNGRQEMLHYERNGLLHITQEVTRSDITADGVITGMQWNSRSDILAIQFQVPVTPGDTSSGHRYVLQLWNMNNFHWYLKREIVQLSNDAAASPALFAWCPEQPYTLYLTEAHGQVRRLCFEWDPATVSYTSQRDNPATCIVADGPNVLITPFAIANVPPPFSAAKLVLPGASVANELALSPSGKIAVLASNHTLSIYQAYSPKNSREMSKLPAVAVSVPLQTTTARQLEWYDDDTLVCTVNNNGRDAIWTIDASTGTVLATLNVSDGVTVVRIAARQGVCAVHTDDKHVHRFHRDSNRLDPWILANGGSVLDSECPWIDSIHMEGDEIMVALDARSRLYVHGRTVASDVTSFLLYEKFLLFTTRSHVMRFLRFDGAFNESLLALAPLPNMASGDAFESAYNETWRNIERGSILVVGVPSTVKIVTQMPRGNLETLAPRPLLLDRVREHLDAHQYRTAFLMMRTHRLDLNYLFDHHGKDFIEHIDEFTSQIADVDFFNLFLSALHENDSSEMFISPRPHPRHPSSKGPAKVNLVTTALRESLEKADPVKYRLSVLTTYVKSSPPRLEEVLRIVQAIPDTQTREACVKYVAFLTEVSHLYKVALGMYDFDLVLLVAQISKMDPKEYLPFLRKLQQMEKYYQRYTIDTHLGRHASALANLSHAGEEYFDQCMANIKEHKLYTHALDVYADRPQQLQEVFKLYAQYQFENGRVSEAAQLYQLSGDLETAMRYFINAVRWREALSLAGDLNKSESEVREIADELVDALKVESRFADAAYILTHYLGDHKGAVEAYCDFGLFIEAAQIAARHGLTTDMSDHIKEAVVDACEQMMADIAERKKKHHALVTRLVELRQEKETWARLAIERGETGEQDEDARSVNSLYSVGSAASGSSRGSGRSGRSGKSGKSSRSNVSRGTSRNAGKAERNRHKKGNPLEEHYLVETIQKIFPSTEHQQEVRNVLQGLIMKGEMKLAQQLQEAYGAILNHMASVYSMTTEPLESEDYLKAERPHRATPKVPAVTAWAFDMLKDPSAKPVAANKDGK
eukprot:TRINITY_DN5051_c0_g2_i1.p1 TRINITY_DN5051_c0_g2~~TRINITY_DN5051_c0_g2_i1.p1  ORF type:complete len:1270 (+),score=323.85 TRINITY_DN5051_c0_g2_i1:93-3902(+)